MQILTEKESPTFYKCGNFATQMISYPISWLSVRRLRNLCKLVSTYTKAVLGMKVPKMAYPYAASFEPSNFCNLRCPQCPTGKWLIDKQSQTLSYSDFCYYVDALSPYLMYLNLYFQGEPFLNKHLPDMVAYATRKKIFTCLSTNGHFLTDHVVSQLKAAGLKRLIICVDGATQESYEKYRVGGNLSVVLASIKRCVEAKLPVEVQCLLLESTENEQTTLVDMMKKLGVKKVVFKKAQFYDTYLLPQQDKNRRYIVKNDGTLQVKKGWRNRCWRMWSAVIVDVNGNLLPCCYDKFAQYAYGNILKQSFVSIWNGEKAQAFRRKVFSDRGAIPICRNCTE